MKKLIFMLTTIFLLPFGLFAATGETESLLSFEEIFATVGGMVAATVTLTEVLKQWTGANGNWARAISWLSGFVISYVGWFLNMGLLFGLTWWQVIVYGLGVSLAANGIFDIPAIQNFINLILNAFRRNR